MTCLKSMYLFSCFDLEYNDLKTELKDYLKRFADEGTVCMLHYNILIIALYVLNKLFIFLDEKMTICLNLDP